MLADCMPLQVAAQKVQEVRDITRIERIGEWQIIICMNFDHAGVKYRSHSTGQD